MGCLCSAIPHNLPLGDRGIHLGNLLLVYLLSDLVTGTALVLVKASTTSLTASQFCCNALPADIGVGNVCTAGAIPHRMFAPRATWRVSDVQALELLVDITLVRDGRLWDDLLSERLVVRC